MGGLGETCSMGQGTDRTLPGMLKESELLLSSQALSIFAKENSSNPFYFTRCQHFFKKKRKLQRGRMVPRPSFSVRNSDLLSMQGFISRKEMP